MSTDSEPRSGAAEEARRLMEALGDWASSRLGAADEHLATGSAECRVCPVCQLISALRGDRPEVLARLGEAWTAFLDVLTHPRPPAPGASAPGDASKAGGLATPGGPATDEPPAPDEAAAAGSAPVRPVQNIDVR